ncbi:MAG: hypothetical protein H0T73_22370 [Ardenticatenales bacterium]|nr:hypothetical protein [Ardenticatenales bacterium]
MQSAFVTREKILDALRAALEPLEYVDAMWQAGAAAFGRVDEWSDIDLLVVVDDEKVAEVSAVIEETLASLSPIDLKLPMPSPHGHTETFYRLREASPFLLVDLSVIPRSNPTTSQEREIHGTPVVHFDKRGVTQAKPLLAEAEVARLRARLATLRGVTELINVLTLKELNRGNHMEALAFYHAFTLRSLVELLRIKHCPARSDFHTRYLYYDLPSEVVQRLEGFFFVASGEALREKQAQAEVWVREVIDSIELKERGDAHPAAG